MRFALTLASFIVCTSIATADDYCIPPIPGPVYGSGITRVQLDCSPALDRQSPGNELYLLTTDTVTLVPGQTYHVIVTPDPSNMFPQNNARVWIDWNSDYVFDTTDEQVGAWDNFSRSVAQRATFVVPVSARLGASRMRVYMDMTVSEGHDPPNPCGYAHSSNPYGQHGEVEDYPVRIASAADVHEAPPSHVSLAPWPDPCTASLSVPLAPAEHSARVVLIDALGRNVAHVDGQGPGVTLGVDALPRGAYLLQIAAGSVVRRERVLLVR